MIKIKVFLFAVLVSVVAACGGGGGGGGGGGATGGGTGGGGTGGGTGGGGTGTTDPLGDVGTKEEEAVRLFVGIADELIAPGYVDFRAALGSLQTALGDVCAATPSATLTDAQAAWRDAMTAWQGVQQINFGPVILDTISFRIQFYPDSNNAVQNNVEQVLAGTAAIDEALVANSAVGAQGLPALEYLLFVLQGLDDPADGPRRCEFASAVAANLITMATVLVDEWQGTFRDEFVAADVDEVITRILAALAVHAEFIADRKIGDPVNASSTALLESFRAETSLDNIRVNIDAYMSWLDDEVDTTYRLADYVERVLEADTLTTMVAEELSGAEVAADGISATFEDIVAGQATGDIETIRLAFQALADLMVDIGVEAGVDLGFNNQDGD
ncbi:MAG: imelysin family protein [Pseudomonadota bacterium]